MAVEAGVPLLGEEEDDVAGHPCLRSTRIRQQVSGIDSIDR